MNIPSDAELKEIVQRVVQRTLAHEQSETAPASSSVPLGRPGSKVVAIGADHGGYKMKDALISYIQELGYAVNDCGTNSGDAVDYPDYAAKVGVEVSQGRAWRGIMIDGAGIGSCMAANRVPGVRAAMCYDYATANNAREHNNANYLTLGAGLIGASLAKQIVKTFLETDFGGGRHAKRVDKITALEK